MNPSPAFWGISQVGWQAIASLAGVGVLFAGAFAAYFALRQVQAARELREEQTRPYVIADFEPGLAWVQMMDFTLRNIGQTPARDVTVRLSPEPKRAKEEERFPLADSRLFSGTLPVFAPGRELRVFFDNMPERYSAGLPMSFDVDLTYRDNRGKTYHEKSIVDMDVARGSLYTTVYGTHDVAKRLKDIVGILKKSAIAKGPVDVVFEDREDYRARKDAEYGEAMRAHREIVEQVLPGSHERAEEEG